MKVPSGRGHGGVPQGSLNEMDRGAAVERMAGMRVAQPVRGDGGLDTGALSRLAHDAQDGYGLQCPALFAGPE